MTDSMLSYVDFNYYPSEQLNPYPMNRHPFHLNLTQSSTNQQQQQVPIKYDKFYYFIHLPKSLQLKILSYLNLKTRLNSSYSCKLIRNLINSAELWESIDISPCFWELNKFQLLFLSKLGRFELRRANFRGCQQIDGNILLTLGANSPNLTNINLSSCSELTSQNLSNFLYFTKNLTVLNLSGLACLTPITLTSIAENCPKLIELNLNWCKLIGNNEVYLRKLINRCKLLVRLKINGWKYISSNALNSIAKLKDLRFLDMQNCQGLTNFRSSNSTDNQLNYTTLEGLLVGDPIKKLEYLNLNSSNLVTDQSFQNFSLQLPLLNWLDISNCPQLKSNTLNSIILNCPLLTHLSLEDTPIANDLNLRLICINLNNLQWLNLGFNICITDEGIGRLLRNLKNLNYLSIEGCNKVTDNLIQNLNNWISKGSRLECLNLKECKLISFEKVLQFQRGLLVGNGGGSGRRGYCNRVKLLSSFDYLDNHNDSGGGIGFEGSGFGELVGLTSCIIL